MSTDDNYRAAGMLPPREPEAEFDDSTPSDTWKVSRLREYAEANAIDLGSATLKPDILAAITAALTDTNEPA